MNELQIETEYDGFYPGTDALVTAVWDLSDEEHPPAALEVRLVWNTTGKGDSDLSIVQQVRFEPSSTRGRKSVTLKLPWGPYSFSGKLISLIWAIELVAFPRQDSVRKEIIIGPNSEEVLIGKAKASALDSDL